MHTDNDIKDNVFHFLVNSELKTAVSGEIRKISRSPHSADEDVIISVLANDSPKQIQQAFVNVNVYVKDVEMKAGNEIYLVEDTNRTKELSKVMADLFKSSVNGDGYRLSLENQRVLKGENTHEHVISTRLLYQCVNEK